MQAVSGIYFAKFIAIIQRMILCDLNNIQIQMILNLNPHDR